MDLKFKDNSQLRLGYTQLEYIESTGTQYINTGFKPQANDEFEVAYMITGTISTYNSVFGTRVNFDSKAFMFGYYKNNGSYIQLGSTHIDNFNKGYTQNVKHTIKLEGGKLYVDDVYDRDITVNQSTLHNLLLFALNENGRLAEYGRCRIYNFTIKRAGVKVLDLLPANNGSVFCMYDTVSGTFFYNQGTGNFIAGPVVKFVGMPETILLKTTTLYHKNNPNINGLQLLNNILNYQKTHQDELILLNRIRVDVGNVSGSLSELLQYVGMAGFNDNYEPQTKPRLVGTWTINDWYTQEQLAAAQAAFDGLTIVPDSNYLINFDDLAVQVLDPNQDNYNPAVAIILQGHNLGTTIATAPRGHGRWFMTKTQAANVTFGYNWFYGKTTLTDTQGIVTNNTESTYDFEEFNELKYFNSIPPLSSNDGVFYNCSKLKYVTLPASVTSIPTNVRGGFGGCTSLISINLDNITSLGSEAFIECSNLEISNFPIRVTYLGASTFHNCSKLAFTNLGSVKIIDGQSYMGCFMSCDNLKNTLTEIPSTVTKIGSGAFRNVEFPYLHILSTTPPTGVDSFTFDKTIKLYVGNGISEADDNALLETYQNASGWSGYSSKLDTWYNYLHPTT